MCMSTEVRISTDGRTYEGTRTEIELISAIVQHFIVSHERAFICNVSGMGQMSMVIYRPERILRER